MSVEPPGVKGTMMRTGWSFGQGAAPRAGHAGDASNAAPAVLSNPRRRGAMI
jgi:hypothetical protein